MEVDLEGPAVVALGELEAEVAALVDLGLAEQQRAPRLDRGIVEQAEGVLGRGDGERRHVAVGRQAVEFEFQSGERFDAVAAQGAEYRAFENVGHGGLLFLKLGRGKG